MHEYILEATGATSMICTVPRPKPSSVVDLNVSTDSSNSTARSENRSSGVVGGDNSDAESDDDENESVSDAAVTESVTCSEASSSASKLPDDTMEFRLNDLTADASYK